MAASPMSPQISRLGGEMLPGLIGGTYMELTPPLQGRRVAGLPSLLLLGVKPAGLLGDREDPGLLGPGGADQGLHARIDGRDRGRLLLAHRGRQTGPAGE